MNKDDIRLVLHDIFTRRGIPKFIKVDNGRPFGDPGMDRLPPLALWLIGLGIKVIWNRPRTPQDNAKVERCQGTLGLWTEYEKCHNVDELQEKLRNQADFYNNTFRDRRQGDTRRIDRFPSMETSPRKYKPEQFSTERIVAFVAEGTWSRKVSATGQVCLHNIRFSLGQQYRKQQVLIRLDITTMQWIVSDREERLITQLNAVMNLEWVVRKL